MAMDDICNRNYTELPCIPPLFSNWFLNYTMNRSFQVKFRMVSYDTQSQEFLQQFKNKLRVHRAVRIPVVGDDPFII
jgi:hypothetical protein